MKHKILLTALLASVIGMAHAQDLKKVYLIKDNKVVATYKSADVDYITFSLPHGVSQSITPKQGANTTLVMYNSSDDWEKEPEERKFDNVAGKLVKFMWWADYGFVGNLKITTESGEDIDYYYVTDDEEFGKCWECVMPEEAITIETSAVEKTDYVGRAFVGDYKGYLLGVGSNGVTESHDPSLSLTLNSNTSFYATPTGSKTFGGCYAFDDSNNTFEYLEETSADVYGKKTYGVSGKWFDSGDALVTVNDLNDDKPDNNKLYIVSNKDFDFVSAASDSYGSRYLLEMRRDNGSTWYYYDHLLNNIQPVTLVFSKGASIADASQAMVYDAGGSAIVRYSRESDSSAPTFTLKSREAGTYTSASGAGSQLVLDGFGNATYGNVSGSYTVSNGVLTLTTSSSETLSFVLDTENMTYTASAASVWDGPENYAAAVVGRYDSNTASAGMLAISLNRDFSDVKQEGSVKVQATLTTDMYDTREIISNTASYAYDASSQQITISGLLVGTADGRHNERINITFDVSADKSTITCNEDKLLRAVSGGDTRYINLKGLTLTAR